MSTLHTEPRIADPDGFYEELIDSQRELSDEQVELMNAKLVLILANHIGDRAVLSAALKLARPTGT
ncbi:DUF2783 domain-containing protein [Ideonella sp. 4Y16]|uniref:DUF2783 domain-containing protein n=1 Tax=Ideonella alba TaxID=2824118 RepID=A0A940Y850_9BURK|nr:DUF2783 domain-containing protein [Ideonella alba]MBQ0929965.1 DUF2783 domain-containing protein [Ideonella alba]MBQ0946021.1 DUF2783 domain-containing protein [Ideonella alba]